jgi:hypothetical protein
MQSIEEIKKHIKEIEDDSRMKGPRTNIQINAPLALIQLSMSTKLDTLKWVLGDDGDEY